MLQLRITSSLRFLLTCSSRHLRAVCYTLFLPSGCRDFWCFRTQWVLSLHLYGISLRQFFFALTESFPPSEHHPSTFFSPPQKRMASSETFMRLRLRLRAASFASIMSFSLAENFFWTICHTQTRSFSAVPLFALRLVFLVCVPSSLLHYFYAFVPIQRGSYAKSLPLVILLLIEVLTSPSAWLGSDLNVPIPPYFFHSWLLLSRFRSDSPLSLGNSGWMWFSFLELHF